MNNKKLCFFTQSYPYGYGETFIENELIYLANYFDEIYLFPRDNGNVLRSVPKNVKIIHINNITDSKSILKNNLFCFIYILFREFFFSNQKYLFFKNLKYNLKHMLNCIAYANKIEEALEYNVLKSAYFYSYWFFDWNFSLSILSWKEIITKNITKAHGFDLYEDNGSANYLPSRYFCLENTDKIFPISKFGENYLKKIYPQFKHKINHSYIGTNDYGTNPIPQSNEPIHIVSCSGLSSVKRINLIIDILKYVKVPLKWTHIGDGALKDNLLNRTKELSKNIEINFIGRLLPNEIFSFYAKQPIDVFINTSISEGLPVSIIEAISFGIPVIATNVGGTGEIVTHVTGYLIDKDVDLKSTASLIETIRSKTILKRERIKCFWKNNFSADKNYNTFIDNFF